MDITQNLEKIRKKIKKQTIDNIVFSYDMFKKDVRRFKDSVTKLSDEQKSIISTLKNNINNMAIFLVEDKDDDIKYKIKIPTIPYTKFYIGTNVAEIIGDDIYRINGFHFLDMGDFLLYSCFWSRTIRNGWKPIYGIISKSNLKNNLSAEEIIQNADLFESKDFFKKFTGKNTTPKEIDKNMSEISLYKAIFLLKKMIYKISKNEYNSYRIYSHGIYNRKTIVNSHYVISHRRHFWEDSGKFKIPTLSRKEILSKGYGIEDMVYRDGELRKNIPYIIIGSFKVGDVNKKKINKEYNLIRKRIWRREEKIYKILIEIFPDKIIRRHDRKTLKGIEIDFNLPELRLGIEYDGEQHFDEELYKKLYGDGFDAQVSRDRKKERLCIKKKINLIRIKYDEPLTKTNIRKKLRLVGIHNGI